MTSRSHDAPRNTGLAIAGVVAIPFASVTSAAWLGTTASSTEPRDALAGVAALAGGLVMGLLVRRLVTTVDHHVRGVVRFVDRALSRVSGPADAVAPGWRIVIRPVSNPAMAFLPAEVGRRGPPIRLR
ncbi:MAG: hypothetical protein AAGC53_06855 [Actinomycetota bacterium]